MLIPWLYDFENEHKVVICQNWPHSYIFLRLTGLCTQNWQKNLTKIVYNSNTDCKTCSTQNLVSFLLLFTWHTQLVHILKAIELSYTGASNFQELLWGRTLSTKRKNPRVGSRPALLGPGQSPWQGSKAAPPCERQFVFGKIKYIISGP